MERDQKRALRERGQRKESYTRCRGTNKRATFSHWSLAIGRLRQTRRRPRFTFADYITMNALLFSAIISRERVPEKLSMVTCSIRPVWRRSQTGFAHNTALVFVCIHISIGICKYVSLNGRPWMVSGRISRGSTLLRFFYVSFLVSRLL